MTTLTFTKGHGTHNDFVLLFDEHGEIDLSADLVRFLCDRRAGIGGDGVIRAVKAGALTAGQGHDPSLWFMDYWNSDGTLSEMCGNGARVFGALLERDAGVDARGGITFATRGGVRTVTSLGESRYAVGMGAWKRGSSRGFDAEVRAGGLTPARPALSVNVGNPHHVVALASIDELEKLDLTSPPRVTPPAAHGSNVEFAVTLGGTMMDGEPRGRVRMRVHERGSGETQSCGTGACAVAVAVRSWAGPGAPSVWDIEVPGGTLTVRLHEDCCVLEGPALLVADGVIEVPGE